MLRIKLTDSRQQAAIIDAIQARADRRVSRGGRQNPAVPREAARGAQLARFEAEALSAELDESAPDARPALRLVDGDDG